MIVIHNLRSPFRKVLEILPELYNHHDVQINLKLNNKIDLGFQGQNWLLPFLGKINSIFPLSQTN